MPGKAGWYFKRAGICAISLMMHPHRDPHTMMNFYESNGASTMQASVHVHHLLAILQQDELMRVTDVSAHAGASVMPVKVACVHARARIK